MFFFFFQIGKEKLVSASRLDLNLGSCCDSKCAALPSWVEGALFICFIAVSRTRADDGFTASVLFLLYEVDDSAEPGWLLTVGSMLCMAAFCSRDTSGAWESVDDPRSFTHVHLAHVKVKHIFN